MTLAELIATMPNVETKSDAKVLAWLGAGPNAELVDVVGAIGSRTLLRWAAASGRLNRLEDAKANHADGGVRSLAGAALLVVQRADTELDMADTSHVALVDGLVAAGVLTSTEKDELTVLATTEVPRYRANGLPQPRMGDVQEARA